MFSYIYSFDTLSLTFVFSAAFYGTKYLCYLYFNNLLKQVLRNYPFIFEIAFPLIVTHFKLLPVHFKSANRKAVSQSSSSGPYRRPLLADPLPGRLSHTSARPL